ncbi:nicotinamide N-methyltransferase-like [Anomaloglossus baeobatrachus]|uniref:nicotinamide N-methyltransferase-like n=1 Tax=Anomaloglossus baeobatrachus TaxID=238106 RepID=UPI003F4F4134
MDRADDAFTIPMKKLHSTFSQGHIKGDTLIDVSYGSLIYHLLPASHYFKQIIILRDSDSSIAEINKFVNKRTGAFDWSCASKILAGITGNSDGDTQPDTNVRSTVQPVRRYDLTKENITDPEVLPKADAVTTVDLLDTISKDGADFERYLKTFYTLLKPGGRLLLFGMLNTSSVMMGGQKVNVFKYDEQFVRETLNVAGFIIDEVEVNAKKAKSDLVNNEGEIFVAAHKNK